MGDHIVDEGYKFVSRDAKAKYKGDADQLLKRATTFLIELDDILGNYNHHLKLMKESSLTDIKKVMVRSKARLEAIIAAQYAFEADVNNFLGRSIE